MDRAEPRTETWGRGAETREGPAAKTGAGEWDRDRSSWALATSRRPIDLNQQFEPVGHEGCEILLVLGSEVCLVSNRRCGNEAIEAGTASPAGLVEEPGGYGRRRSVKWHHP